MASFQICYYLGFVELIRELNIDKIDVLTINCSNEKIDGLRDRVISFASTMPMGELKIVQLEEFDMMSLEGQGLLRSVIEDSSATCRFIATGNYLNKIIPELRSRFKELHFTAPAKMNVMLRCAEILVAENIEFSEDALIQVVDAAYPDIRKTIGNLELGSTTGVLVPITSGSGAVDLTQLIKAIKAKNLANVRKIISEDFTRPQLNDIPGLLYEQLAMLNVKDEAQATILLAHYAAQHTLAASPDLNIAALCVELMLLGDT